MEPDVTAKEVIDALKEKGFSAKETEPQPFFKVELEPDSRVFKKNEVHPFIACNSYFT